MRRHTMVAMLLAVTLVWIGGAPVGAQGSADAWAGTWQTDHGIWTLETSGDQVLGTNETDGGRIFGVVVGDRLVGGWAEPPTFAPPDDAGDLELTLNADGTAFTGRIRSGAQGAWQAAIGVRSDQPATATLSALTLVRVELPPELGAGRLRAIIAGGSGHIAVGSTGGLDQPAALILTSSGGDDGASFWSPLPLEGAAAFGDVVDITAFPGGYAAVGTTGAGDAAQIWLSPDGDSWEAITSRVLADAHPTAIVEHGGGLFVVGCVIASSGDCSGTVTWTSPEGQNWDRALPVLDPTWQFRDAASIDGRLFLVGDTGVDETATAVVATSDDAFLWEGREVLGAALLDGVAAASDGGVVAAGWRFEPSGALGLLLRSDDGGVTWVDTGLSAGAGSLFTGVALGDVDMVVLGGFGPPFSEPEPAAWWLDADGQLQRMSTADGGVLGAGILTDYAPFRTTQGGVAVGIEADRDGEQPVIWVVEPAGEEPSATPEPTPTPTAKPTRTPRPTPRPTPAPATVSAAERYLINGVAPRIRSTCAPKRDDLPDGTVAAILCTPDVAGVARVGYYLMSTRDANTVLRERRDEYLGSQPDWGCDTGDPGIWGGAGFAGRAICYRDAEGRPNLRVVEFSSPFCHPDPVTLGGTMVRKPTVYVGVLGSTDIRELTTGWLRRLRWNYPDGVDPPDQGDSTGGPSCGEPWPRP